MELPERLVDSPGGPRISLRQHSLPVTSPLPDVIPLQLFTLCTKLGRGPENLGNFHSPTFVFCLPLETQEPAFPQLLYSSTQSYVWLQACTSASVRL